MTITQLTTNGISQNPDIFGNKIVWTEDRSDVILFDGTSSTVLPDLDLNLVTSPKISAEGILWKGYVNGWQNFYYDGILTTQFTNGSFPSDVKLWGTHVAWRNAPANSESSMEEVYLYDGNTETTIQLTDNDSRESSVDIDGENIVWRGADNTVYLYHDHDMSVMTLTNNGVNPHVSEDQVVWESYTGGTKDQINLYDGNTTTQIANNDTIWLQGFFDGNVIWSQWDGNDFELFRYNGNRTLQITDNDFNDRLNPDSTPSSFGGDSSSALAGSEDNLVWSSYVNGNWEIFYYDGTDTIQVTDNDIDDLNPQISGDHIVWHSDGKTSDIFLYEPNTNPVGVSFADNFDPDIEQSQWQEISHGFANNNFAGSGNSLFFTNGFRGDDSRSLTTTGVNVKSGGEISFELIFGDSSNGGENAEPGEDVILEYSVDDGANWQEIAIYDTEAYTTWTGISETIPIDAQTDSTLFRWMQLDHSGSGYDNWGLDNIQIE